MKGKSLMIVVSLIIALCWINPSVSAIRDDSRMVAEAEVIGQVVLLCGCPAYILFIETGEYGLVIPTHNEAYKSTVTQEDGKLTVTMIMVGGPFHEVYTSVPPYEKWWRESEEDWLTEGMIGFMVLDIIRDHYQKSGELGIKT